MMTRGSVRVLRLVGGRTNSVKRAPSALKASDGSHQHPLQLRRPGPVVLQRLLLLRLRLRRRRRRPRRQQPFFIMHRCELPHPVELALQHFDDLDVHPLLFSQLGGALPLTEVQAALEFDLCGGC